MSLLDLPRELRDMIYEYAIRSDSVATLQGLALCHGVCYGNKYFPITSPSLTRVNRQIRSETLPVFYRCDIKHMSMWMSPDMLTRCLNWIRATQDNFCHMDGIFLKTCCSTDAWKSDAMRLEKRRGIKLCFFKGFQKEALQKIQADCSGRYHYASTDKLSIKVIAPSYDACLIRHTGGWEGTQAIDQVLQTIAQSLRERDMELVLDLNPGELTDEWEAQRGERISEILEMKWKAQQGRS